MSELKLSNGKVISDTSPAYVILDVAANHNNSLDVAKQLVKEAAEAGADAVKFQTYTADKLYSKNTPKFSKDELKPYDLIKSVEHPREWLPILNDYAQECGIDFLSSPFDYEAVDLLDELDTPCFKVASSEIVDLELIRYIAKKGRAIIISTGMANLAEIEEALQVCYEEENYNVALLHCNTAYPTPFHIVNLSAISTLKSAFKLLTGYSDHTLGHHISLGAISMGAKIIEKHFTLDAKQSGPDHNFAVEPKQLKIMMKEIRNIEAAMGDGIKRVYDEELESYEKGRRSLVMTQKVKKGEKITREMIMIKRPGYGIKPNMLSHVIGRTLAKDIGDDEVLTWEYLI
jgi:sialic acid synthase SpsE